MLLRLAHPGVANVFALLRLLPVNNQDKDAETLALRHQITVLERQLGRDRGRFAPSDRVFLAALLHRLPRGVLRRARLLVRPDTVLHWHRDLVSRRHAARSRPGRAGRPRTVHSIRVLVLRLARENPGWSYRRIHGELLVLGVQVAASTVWEILKEAGIDPAPERGSSTWTDFLRSQFEDARTDGENGENMDGLDAGWSDDESVTVDGRGPARSTLTHRACTMNGTTTIGDDARLRTVLTLGDRATVVESRGGLRTGWSRLDDTVTGHATYTTGVPRDQRHAVGTTSERYRL
ncbi:hypothetical protein GCM10010339_17850 [Streptomyces alanosinicus]|uniref:Integrase n=1 Tax=Streptomyces alanosinicus TaxID=68171 RepID=A0A919D1G5_9ACTN|nr:hypothetical protein GCM10010339_17850 [Streptomyces alanosinicus]